MTASQDEATSAAPVLAGNPAVIVLAAGRGERFKASGAQVHKLEALLLGKSVLKHVTDAVEESGLPYYVVRPAMSLRGMGDSIAAGVRATQDASGWLILPGDLPAIHSATILQVAHALALQTSAVVRPMYDAQFGHPVGFARECLPDLLALHGDQGANAVVRHHQAHQRALALAVNDPGILMDVDCLKDLDAAAQYLGQRPEQL